MIAHSRRDPFHRACDDRRTDGGMKKKPVNPYTELRTRFERYKCAVKFPERIVMFSIAFDKLRGSYRFDDIYERTHAADALGWDVRLRAGTDGLRFEYIRRPKED